MKKIENSDVNVEKNTLKFQYGTLEASIDPILNEKELSFRLSIFDRAHNKVFFIYFYTLEDTINFAENVLPNCLNIGDVINTYKNMLTRYDEEHKKFMNEIEVMGAISNYFCADKQYKVTVGKDLYIEQNAPKIRFYLFEEYDIGGRKIANKVYLTEGDIVTALNNHLKKQNCEVESFNYVGGIHRVGYYFEKDTPYFEGLEVYTKDLDKEKEYCLSRRQVVSN